MKELVLIEVIYAAIIDNSDREKLLGQHPLCEQAIDSTPVSKNEREKERLSRYSSRLYKKIFATHDIHVVHRGFPELRIRRSTLQTT